MKEVNDGDVITVWDLEFTLKLVSTITMNERYIKVFREHSDDDIDDHFTFQVVDIDEVTVLEHGHTATAVFKLLAEYINEAW